MAVNEAKKVLRRELKKRIAAMTDEAKLTESTSIVNKVNWSPYKFIWFVRSLLMWTPLLFLSID